MSNQELNHLSSKELKAILDSELKSQNPDYTKISLIGNILSERDSSSGTSSSNTKVQQQPIFQNHGQVVKDEQHTPKPGLLTRLRGSLSAKQFQVFFVACLLGGFYMGSYFFRLA